MAEANGTHPRSYPKSHPRPQIKNVLIIGNQNISSTLLLSLSQNPTLTLTVLTNPSQTPSLPRTHTHCIPPTRIAHKTSDFTPTSLRDVFMGQDLVISTTSGGDYNTQTRIVNAAVAAGVTRFVASEFGHDSLNGGVRARLPPSAERARVLRYLRGMQREGVAGVYGDGLQEQGLRQERYVKREKAPGYDAPFEWVGVAVGCVLDKKLINGDLGFDIKWQSATVHGKGTEQFAATSLERVGQVVAKVIERWDEVKNRYLYAAGCITTANEVVEYLQKTTNRDWTVGYVEIADCVNEGVARMKRGFPDAGMFLMERSVLYDESLEAAKSFKTNSTNGLLGLEDEKVEDIVRGAVHDFNHHGKAECGCS